MGFVKKATLLGASEFLLACGGVSSSVIYSRFLGPDGVGQFSVFMSTLTIVVPLSSLGIGRANIYFLNTSKFTRQQVISNSMLFGVAVGIVLTTGMSIYFRLREDFYGAIPIAFVVAFSFGMACRVVISLLRPVFIATLASRKLICVDVIQRVVMIAAALVVALSGMMTVGWAMCITMLGGLAGMLLVLFFLRDELRQPIPFQLSWFRETAAYGVKIAASSILFTITASLTVLILRHGVPEDFQVVGYYTRAVAICGFAVLIPRALSPLFYAKWSGASIQNKTNQIERAARFNVFYGMGASIGLLVFGKLAIYVLYGSEFLPAHKVLYLFAPAMLLTCLFSIFNSVLSSDGKAATTARVLGCSLILVAVLAYVLVPTLGMYGAAIAVLCGNLLSTVVLALTCRKLYGLQLSKMVLLSSADVRYLIGALSK